MRSEQKMFEGLDLDQAFKKAESVIERDEIKIEGFGDLYGEDNIAKDQAYVREKEEQFKKSDSADRGTSEALKLSRIFEAIVHEQAELGEWFGPEAITIKPSRFDDIRNGVDEVVEFQEGEGAASYLAMAIDVTFGDDVHDKFQRIKEEIRNGKLGVVKYFQSEHMNMRGELKNVPRVVVGADVATVKELSGLWLEGENKGLAAHRVQFQILEEILIQARAFKEYARSVGSDQVAAAYERMEARVLEVYEDKRSHTDSRDVDDRDSIFSALRFQLKIFEN